MSIVVMLEAEHENLGRLLDLVERGIARLDDGDARVSELLRAVLAYWQEYPDYCHHPKEDLLLQMMVKRGLPDAVRIREAVTAEHRELRELTERAAQVFGSLQGAQVHEDEALRPLLERLVERNRRHMAMEEAQVFPLARRFFGGQEWEDIEFDLLDRSDPVFDRLAEARFRILRDAILSFGEDLGADARQAAVRVQLGFGDTAWLAAVEDLEQFNALLDASTLGRDLRLQAMPQGGYRLCRGEDTVTEIPACDPLRAAWCAYYYLLGAERGYPGGNPTPEQDQA